jgi:RNA polymerase sigma factor (sigma-70 family)
LLADVRDLVACRTTGTAPIINPNEKAIAEKFSGALSIVHHFDEAVTKQIGKSRSSPQVILRANHCPTRTARHIWAGGSLVLELGPKTAPMEIGQGMPDMNTLKAETLERQERQATVTADEYGDAYHRGFPITVRFLVSRGVSYDTAVDTAQAAWAKGWERRSQLRDHSLVSTWANSIAWNIHRSSLRRDPAPQAMIEVWVLPHINLAAIDVNRALATCRPIEREVLESHYFEGYKVQEIAERHGWTETAVRIRLLRARRSVERKLATMTKAKRRRLAADSKEAISKARNAASEVTEMPARRARVLEISPETKTRGAEQKIGSGFSTGDDQARFARVPKKVA